MDNGDIVTWTSPASQARPAVASPIKGIDGMIVAWTDGSAVEAPANRWVQPQPTSPIQWTTVDGADQKSKSPRRPRSSSPIKDLSGGIVASTLGEDDANLSRAPRSLQTELACAATPATSRVRTTNELSHDEVEIMSRAAAASRWAGAPSALVNREAGDARPPSRRASVLDTAAARGCASPGLLE
jgi:hypothetical protein